MRCCGPVPVRKMRSWSDCAHSEKGLKKWSREVQRQTQWIEVHERESLYDMCDLVEMKQSLWLWLLNNIINQVAVTKRNPACCDFCLSKTTWRQCWVFIAWVEQFPVIWPEFDDIYLMVCSVQRDASLRWYSRDCEFVRNISQRHRSVKLLFLTVSRRWVLSMCWKAVQQISKVKRLSMSSTSLPTIFLHFWSICTEISCRPGNKGTVPGLSDQAKWYDRKIMTLRELFCRRVVLCCP
jgi:hypothetical protein